MPIPENDTQLWKGFNGHGLYSKRAERDVDGNVIDQTYAKKADVPALDTVLSDSSTTAITPKAVKDAIADVDVIPELPQNPSSLYSESQGSLAWGGWESEDVDVPDNIMYHTNFENFDVSTGIDHPITGADTSWGIYGTFNKTTKTIDGVEYPCMRAYDGSMTMLSNAWDDYEDDFSIEVTTCMDGYSGNWGGAAFVTGMQCPYYNCWNGDAPNRGICIWAGYNSYSGSTITLYNDFRVQHDSFGIVADSTQHANVSRAITGGVTVSRKNREILLYLDGKKAVKISNADAVMYKSFIATTIAYYILDFKILNGNRFAEMEG